MESAKKILPFLAVAIIFAVGGYFIGAGNLNNQEGALYKAPKLTTNAVREWSVGSDGNCYEEEVINGVRYRYGQAPMGYCNAIKANTNTNTNKIIPVTPGAAGILAWTCVTAGGSKSCICIDDDNGNGHPHTTTDSEATCVNPISANNNLNKYLLQGKIAGASQAK